MKNYEHSKTFDIMKVTKESISDNYTTLQYLQTLDYFLWNAIEPIARACPTLFLNYFAKVVTRQTLRASAKLTSDNRSKLPIHLFNTVVSPNPDKMIANAKLLYINRGILFGFVSLFRNRLIAYKELHTGSHKVSPVVRRTMIHRCKLELGVLPEANLYETMLEVEYWDDQARAFKEMIIQKYTRLALIQAQHTYKSYNHYVRLDDVVQIYLNVVDRAINRCDSRQGVLTTFIQNWFKSARGEVAEMCKSQQDQSYESLHEDHGDSVHSILGVTLPDISAELQQQIAFISKQIDPDGLVRAALGIPEFVSAKQKAILERLSLGQ